MKGLLSFIKWFLFGSVDDDNQERWQRINCCGCRHSDYRLAGTGDPCCEYPGKLDIDKDGNCLTRKDKK